MTVVKIPPVLRPATAEQREVVVKGESVGDVLDAVVLAHPEIGSHLYAEEGELNRYLNVYLNDEDVRVLEGLQTRVSESDTITLLPAMAGG